MRSIQQAIKIAVTGTHCTGKTSRALELAEELASQNPGCSVGIVRETVRDCPLPINEKMTADAQLWIMAAQIGAEIQACAQHDIVVCDRCILDPYIYAGWMANEMIHSGDRARAVAFVAFLSNIGGLTMSWLRTYEMLYWRRPGHDRPLVGDGFRSIDPRFRRDIDSGFAELLPGLCRAGIIPKLIEEMS